ncbi:hypothetical protein ACIQLK_04880 [Microbacterium sp. NPDC091382]|uniref:hypothetical protein n=1 Tax=Microbacterium sp. NPDC091382 TaxID=3364210 RepID=UPI0037F59AB6
MTPTPAHPIPAPFAALGVALIPEQRTGLRARILDALSRQRPHRTTARAVGH